MARHLAKLFDSISQLKFVMDESGQPTKVALGMYSKDGEYVDFDKPCECAGQVSRWSFLSLNVLYVCDPFLENVPKRADSFF